jgi:hypothetical protein
MRKSALRFCLRSLKMSPPVQPIILGENFLPVTQRHRYERLQGPRSFRLLKAARLDDLVLACTLECFELGESPPFNALSYTWGPPLYQPQTQSGDAYSDRQYDILCNGALMSVGENVFKALGWWANCSKLDQSGSPAGSNTPDSSRSDTPDSTDSMSFVWLWVDAVCIDQSNIEERTAQVLIMGSIYAAAQQVDVWLGDSDDDIEGLQAVHHELLPALYDLFVHPDPDRLSMLEKEIPLGPPLMRMLGLDESVERWGQYWRSYFRFYARRRWFQRAWIIQEVALARFVVVRCGAASLLWMQMCDMATMLTVFRWRHKLAPLSGFVADKEQETDTGEVDFLETLQKQCRAGGFRSDEVRKITSRFGAKTEQEHWYCYFSYVIREIRHYQATNAHDKIYAILGMVTKSLPDGMTTPIIPDYRLTTEELYISVASLLIRKVPCLSLLSYVVNHTGMQTEILPSWAPDYRLRDDRTPLVHHGVFKACGTGRFAEGPVSVDDKALCVFGACFDTVSEITPPMVQMIDTNMIQPCFELCLGLSPLYDPTNQTRVEVLWRSMVGDIQRYPFHHPAPQSLGTDFYGWVLYTLSTAPVNLRRNQKEVDSFVGSLSPITDLIMTDEDANLTLPSLSRIIETASIYKTRIENPSGLHAQQITFMNDLLAQERRYYDSLTVHLGCRRLYRTSRGYLGLGPESTAVGDEAWLLQGAKMPFVLRKISNLSSYRLVGETYLHGFMHGEMLGAGLQDQISRVCIV